MPGMRKTLSLFLMFGATACGGVGLPNGSGQSSEPARYRLSDSGIRCFTTPCPALLATPLDAGASVSVSEINFPATMSEQKRHGVMTRATTPEGLVVRGTVHGEGLDGVFELESLIE
jgi:hypothetical protein